MIVNKLSITGFRTIGNKLEISFPESGRIGIFGHNEAGKSTIFDAIEFALFGLSLRGISKEDMISWGKNKLDVKLEFTSNDKKYRLERSLTSKRNHNVKLTQLENDTPIPNSTVTSITSVEESIEDIIGMDKNSYSKLVYIRQKELDALKDLQKRDREKLINKVIGIDIFDDASNSIRSDVRTKNDELNGIKKRLDLLKKNYESYIDKQQQIQDLEPKIQDLENTVNELIEKTSELNEKLTQYEWIKDYNAKKDVLQSKKSEYESKSSELAKLKSDKSVVEKFQSVIDNFKPKLDQLNEIQNCFEIKEHELSQEEQKLKEIQSKVPRNFVDTSQLKQKRESNMRTGIIMVILGLISIVAMVIVPYTILLGIVLLVTSAVFFKRYKNYDKQLLANVDNQALFQSINSCKSQIEKITNDIIVLQKQYSKNSSTEIKNEIERIRTQIFNETGHFSIDELQGIISNIKSNNIENIENFENSVKVLKDEIDSLENTLKKFENEKPNQANLEESTEKFENVKKEYEDHRELLNKYTNELSAKKAIKSQLEMDCNVLRSDYEAYPTENDSKIELEHELKLLNFVLTQFSLVSEKMRSKVIPQARYEINQMLPIITGGRYSDFEISEDLKFKVYTEQTGGYKERELFSGGTQDQFLIALRLAFTKSILDSRIKADEYTLFMDETISSSDEARKTGIFELLDKVRSTFKQIFIIAHEDISDVVDHHLILESGPDGYAKIKSKSW
jgi:exonuclease SbcC